MSGLIENNGGPNRHQRRAAEAKGPQYTFDKYAELNQKGSYYFVTAEWLEVTPPPAILQPGDEPRTTITPRKDNFLIASHPVTFWLKNKQNFPVFVVTQAMVITKKMFETGNMFLAECQAAAQM